MFTYPTPYDPTPTFDRLLAECPEAWREVVRRLMGAEVAR